MDTGEGASQWRRSLVRRCAEVAGRSGEMLRTLEQADAKLAAAALPDDLSRSAPRSSSLRQAYVDAVASISDDVAAWRDAGADSEFIAREAWANRRALGIQYKDLTPPDELSRIYARNLEKYGDPLGPSIEWLRGRGRTWDEIIESATRTGGKDLGY